MELSLLQLFLCKVGQVEEMMAEGACFLLEVCLVLDSRCLVALWKVFMTFSDLRLPFGTEPRSPQASCSTSCRMVWVTNWD